MAAQRWQAIEYVQTGGTWENTQNTELIPADNRCNSPTGPDLWTIVKEAEQQPRLNPALSSKGYWKGNGGSMPNNVEENPRE